MRRQRGPVLKVGKIINVDQGGHRLAVIADGDRPMRLPRLGNEFIQMRLCRSQRISHVPTVTPGTDTTGWNARTGTPVP